MKRKHSLKLVIVSLAFLCWLIPILLMVAVMGYYVLSKHDDEQLERLAEQMAASSRICQERLDGAIANSRRISYDKTVQQKYEQYQRGELSYAALYSEVQYYLSVEYSRKKEAAFALIMMNGKEKDESFNVVNSSAGGSYQGILEFWEQDAELVKECAAKLDTAIGFVQNQGRLKYQFDHIYEEELALKDARIMALPVPYQSPFHEQYAGDHQLGGPSGRKRQGFGDDPFLRNPSGCGAGSEKTAGGAA